MALNPNTIARAFNQLQADGVIETLRGRGMVVRDEAGEICRRERETVLKGRIGAVLAEAWNAGLTRKQIKAFVEEHLRELCATEPTVLAAATAEPTPNEEPKQLRSSHGTRHRRGLSYDALSARCDALLGVDLEIRPGTVFALLGENGAGKTTLIRILTGFQKPSGGSCTVCGINPMRNPGDVRRQIGYVSDAPALYDWMTVAQIGGFTASFYGAEFLPNYDEAIRRYEIQPEQKIRHLSKGQRAKVALSLALAHDPSLLIMDEPTSGLDPKVRRSFLESMIDRAATGRTVFLSSHQISEVERVADTIAILHHGRIRLHGPLAEIRKSIHELVIDVDDPLRAVPPPPEPAEVLQEDTSGRSKQLFVRGLEPEMIQRRFVKWRVSRPCVPGSRHWKRSSWLVLRKRRHSFDSLLTTS